MNHFWPGGSSDPTLANFTDPKAPNGARIAWRFLRQSKKGKTAMPSLRPFLHLLSSGSEAR